ncbi:MAG: hypothetical protein B7X39_03335 [Lysobacterales bacterium 14-68-21]|jgi:hypothetical protein|nr:MAG: hypothetical protein B7X45_04965 [Xanthomonadales bacterium 15-68-25]OZB68216.1 MAG: hypothetical protein B7X39_03335 [Xanthomonadales bacterium 14-68-21]
MNKQARYFGHELVRELSETELRSVAGAQVVLGSGQMTSTDTNTDNGMQCDSDSDYGMNLG